MAEINPNGNILGNVTASVYENSGAVREEPISKTLYLDRNITITPQTQPSTPVSIRFYLNNTEFTNLHNAVNSMSQPSNVNTISNLSVFQSASACSAGLTSPTGISTTNQSTFGAGGYVMQANVSSLSTFYMASNTSLLPLHLISFKGSLTNDIGKLIWVSEDEVKLQSYTLERSTDSRDFYPIAIMPAMNEQGQVIYQYADSTIGKTASSVFYYRLKITNSDDNSSYSPVVILNTESRKNGITIYPNPVINNVTVEINAETADKANWVLTDITGKQVLKHVIAITEGKNTLNINLSKVPAGIYYLKVTGNNISQAIKLQKL
jgi:hypothetical protein